MPHNFAEFVYFTALCFYHLFASTGSKLFDSSRCDPALCLLRRPLAHVRTLPTNIAMTAMRHPSKSTTAQTAKVRESSHSLWPVCRFRASFSQDFKSRHACPERTKTHESNELSKSKAPTCQEQGRLAHTGLVQLLTWPLEAYLCQVQWRSMLSRPTVRACT